MKQVITKTELQRSQEHRHVLDSRRLLGLHGPNWHDDINADAGKGPTSARRSTPCLYSRQRLPYFHRLLTCCWVLGRSGFLTGPLLYYNLSFPEIAFALRHTWYGKNTVELLATRVLAWSWAPKQVKGSCIFFLKLQRGPAISHCCRGF